MDLGSQSPILMRGQRRLLDQPGFAGFSVVGRTPCSQLSRQEIRITFSDYCFKPLSRVRNEGLIREDDSSLEVPAKHLLRKRVDHRVEEGLSFQMDLLGVC